MELKYKAIACFLIGIFSLSGCTSTFDDLNTNPDTTTKRFHACLQSHS